MGSSTINSVETPVTGNNNHVVSGNNNTVGVNGDININKSLRLSDEYLIWVYNYTDSLRTSTGTTKAILVSTAPYSNAPLVAEQLISYFKLKGYTIIGNGTLYPGPGTPNLQRFAIGPFENKSGMQIDIGYFEQ